MMNYKFLMFQLQNFVILNSKKKMKKQLHFLILVSLLSATTTMTRQTDMETEATEVTISAEANGKLILKSRGRRCSRAKKNKSL
jgi:hypothetical protein